MHTFLYKIINKKDDNFIFLLITHFLLRNVIYKEIENIILL